MKVLKVGFQVHLANLRLPKREIDQQHGAMSREPSGPTCSGSSGNRGTPVAARTNFDRIWYKKYASKLWSLRCWSWSEPNTCCNETVP
jgi:hypothetical protein